MVEAGATHNLNGSPVEAKPMVNNFSRNILKRVVGNERALSAFQSISMGAIPKTNSFNNVGGKTASAGIIQKAQSLNNIGNFFQNRLEGIRNKIVKGQEKVTANKAAGKSGLDAFIVEDSDESDDSFEVDEEGAGMLTGGEEDPSKLIDLELVNLLRYCNELQQQKENEEYQDEVMMKSIQLGGKSKDRLLIFDMDETLIAAKFEGHIPEGFEHTFKFPFKGTEIQVRLRPYVQDILEKLAHSYEIIVFTAGEQAYADEILNYIDPNKTIFKKRLYRQDCIKLDNFFIKDLDIILDRDREHMCIVDNSILAFAFDLDNGIPINSFVGTEEDDRELLFLYSFLEDAVSAPDIRVKIKESFKLSHLQSSIVNVQPGTD